METSVNNKCKAFTSLEQSRKLAEILPLESADFCWGIDNETLHYNCSPYPCAWKDYTCKEYYIPCWSLTALLNALPNDCGVNKEEDKFVASYLISDECGAYTSDNPIDACYEMIIKLKELNLM